MADRAPVVVGTKATLITQLALTASGEVQPVPEPKLTEKSPGLVPTFVSAKVSGDVPVLVRVNDWTADAVPVAWLPKGIEVGEKMTAGAVPLTLSEARNGLPDALDATVSEPLVIPVTLGVAVTCTVQLPPDGSEAGQLLV